MKLRTKLLIFALPLALLSVGVMTLFSKRAVQSIVFQEVVKRGMSLAAGLAENPEALSGFQTGSEKLLLPALQSLLENTQAIYAVALDPSGRVFAHTNVAEKGKVYSDAITVRVLRAERPDYRRLDVDGRATVDVSYPVWDAPREGSSEEFLLLGEKGAENKTRLGTLRLGLPLKEALETADRISRQVFWIITVVGALVLGVSMLFIQKILLPIRLLADATERLGRGALGETVPVRSADEIGDLGQSFNRMSMDLAETTVSKDFLDSILKNMLDLLIVTTPRGDIRMLNGSVLELLGYAEGELVGKPVGLLFSERDSAFMGTGFEALIQEGSILNREGHFRSRGGEEIPVLFSVSAFTDNEDRVGGFILTAKDITERVEAEEDHRQMERQLIQSERLASVGTVAAGIVHNLKNPLMGILGYGEILRIKHPDMREAGRIISSAEQMNEMIENILAKSRQKQSAEPADLNGLLERELDFMQADLGFKHEVEKEIVLAEDLPPVKCVYTDFSQVFGNLLRNAAEAMRGREEKRLRLTTSLSGECVIVEVGDTGCGISEEDLPHIFDPFFTTKSGDEEKGEPKGTGLGLHMVRQILDFYGATIEVESAVDVGTAFRVMIPIADS